MVKFTSLSLLATLLPIVLAGLEDAKYSTVLSSDNFDKVIAGQSHGTLTAFYAPWCGHCKALEPVWTKVAMAFDGDDRCKLGHLDADQPENKPIAQKYGVSGFPTIKFVPSGGKEPIAYEGGRTEEAFLKFLNKHCGTSREPGGGLSDFAGRIPGLDKLASAYFGPTATRTSLMASASALASTLSTQADDLSAYYLKVMSKWMESTEGSQEWIKKEVDRLGKLASKKGNVASKKLDEMKMKQNILAAFKYVKETAEDTLESAEEAVESIVGRAKEEL